MLAALIATRTIPVPPVIFYGDQFVAATTTFLCASLAKQAAFLSTNPTFSYQLLFSTQGHESIVDSLNRLYYNIVGPQGSASLGAHFTGLNGRAPITMKPPFTQTYLSIQIAAVIAVAIPLNTIIQSLPVASVNAIKLAALQRQMGIALRLLQSLAIPITLNFT